MKSMSHLESEHELFSLEHDYLVFIDETGDSAFHKKLSVYENESVFQALTITALVIPVTVYSEITMVRLDEIKQKYFNCKDVYFHSREIRRKTDIFKIFQDQLVYEKFKIDMNSVIEDSQTTIISSSINKVKLLKRTIDFQEKIGTEYKINDLYLTNVNFVLERLGHFLGSKTATIVFEERGREENKKIQAVLDEVKTVGTFYKSKSEFSGINDRIMFFKKSDNINGLQLADYCVYPFARHARNQNDADNKFFDFLRKYIYKGNYGEYGLKEWP